LDWVKNHNLTGGYALDGKFKQYANKKVRVQALGVEAELLVVDTCGEEDGTCAEVREGLKEKGLALQLDMEFNTVKKLWPQISEPAVSIPESYTLCVWSGEELKQTSLEGESLDSSPEKDTFLTPAPSPRGSSASASGSCPEGWTQARWSAFESWPRCCPGSPNYDPNAPTEECGDEFSGCEYQGYFEYYQCPPDDQCSLDWVKNHNLTGGYALDGKFKQYANKKVRVQALGVEAELLVVDTCGEEDGTCAEVREGLKEKGLALQLDMEFNTVKKLWPQISEPAVSIPESYTLCVWNGEY